MMQAQSTELLCQWTWISDRIKLILMFLLVFYIPHIIQSQNLINVVYIITPTWFSKHMLL